MSAPRSVLLGISAVAALWLGTALAHREAFSSAPAAAEGIRWAYTTMSVEPGELQTRLQELGNDRWEVFSIERAGLAIEQPAANQTRLVADRFQVTARRPAQ